MSYKEKIYGNNNCLMVQGFRCSDCSYTFLTDERRGDLKCPACYGEKLEAEYPIVVGLQDCTHSFDKHGHQYKI